MSAVEARVVDFDARAATLKYSASAHDYIGEAPAVEASKVDALNAIAFGLVYVGDQLAGAQEPPEPEMLPVADEWTEQWLTALPANARRWVMESFPSEWLGHPLLASCIAAADGLELNADLAHQIIAMLTEQFARWEVKEDGGTGE